MCAMFTADPAGNPARVTVKFAVAVEIALAASLVMMSSMRTVPEAGCSTSVMGGTSLAVVSVDVNTGFGVGVGVGVGLDEFEHPAARVITTSARHTRFIVRLLVSHERGDQKN